MPGSAVTFVTVVVVVAGLVLAANIAPTSAGLGPAPGATGSSSSTTTSVSTRSTIVPRPSVVAVGIGGHEAAAFFNPETVTVVIGVNSTVVWSNEDAAIHTVTSTTLDASGVPLFNSGDMAMGAEFSYTFTVPGTYVYICIYHGEMVGKVVAEAQGNG
ncbi:MAG: cupredoxin domain-containing protein [Nitrososphaerota archaeon]|nr:cupredoxin domain-containing protein [Nitrososphaerota archaeon]